MKRRSKGNRKNQAARCPGCGGKLGRTKRTHIKGRTIVQAGCQNCGQTW